MSREIASTIDDRTADIKKDAAAGSYSLNPDEGFVRMLVEGMLKNEERFGYPSCPCRLGTGDKARDLDIICPCDYRDADITDFGACYCSLYVRADIAAGKPLPEPVPERRPGGGRERAPPGPPVDSFRLAWPVWRCRVCGYLCARASPPDPCPVCKARQDRFERFI